MKKLVLSHLDDLAVGAAILGSGGGGDPAYPYMMARYVMEEWGNVSLMSPSEIKADDFIVPVGVIGAPLAEMEKIESGREFNILFEVLEKLVQKKITAILPYEVGGGNVFTPFWIAPILKLPILDADIMGRAFPEAQMTSCGLLGAPCSPCVITDCLGNTAVIHANNNLSLEKIGRQITIAMGSIACIALYPLTGEQAKKMTIHSTISRAIALGKAHREAKEIGKDPLRAVLQASKGTLIGSGKITDIDRAITKGFLKGSVIIQNKTDQIEILFQNEFLLVKVNGQPVATTPDIITLMEMETGTPVASESLQYGLKVNVVVLPSPPLWTTPEGLALVGPRYFGYDMDYIPQSKPKPALESIEVIS